MSALDAAPAVAASPAYEPPVAAEFTTANGSRVWLVERPEIPLVSVRLVVEGGSVTDPDAHPGLTSLADTMLVHGAGERDASAFAETAERLAIDIDAATWTGHTVLSLDAHADRLDDGLALLADAVLRPRFDADEVGRVRDLRKGELAKELDDPGAVAAKVARRVYYGQADPRAHSTDGTTWGIDGVDAGALRASWAARSGADRAHFVVAGAVDETTLRASLERHFGEWGAATGARAALPSVRAEGDAPRLFLVDNPGAAQSILWVILPGPDATSADLQATRMGVIVLGGTFTSRLNRLLREEKGYTYGASARAFPAADHGIIVAHSAVQVDVTGPALADLTAEIARIRGGVDGAETIKAQASDQSGVVGMMDSRGAIASTFADLSTQGLGPDAMRTRLAAAGEADTAAVSAAMARLGLGGGVIVVVGDVEKIRAALAEAVPGEWQVTGKEPPPQ